MGIAFLKKILKFYYYFIKNIEKKPHVILSPVFDISIVSIICKIYFLLCTYIQIFVLIKAFN